MPLLSGISGSLTSWVKGLTARRLGGRSALAAFLLQGSSIGRYTNSWTDSRFEQVRHFRYWVYVAIDTIASEIAMHHPNVSLIHTENEPGNRSQRAVTPAQRSRRLSPYQRDKALTPLRHHEHLEAVGYNHPLARLLRDPNDVDDSYDLWYETVLFLLLTGNAYWWMPPNKMGTPAAIWVIPSHWVYASVGSDRLIDHYEIRPVEGNYIRLQIPAEDILHFKKKSPVSKLDGQSPQSAGAQWIDIQESIERGRWFSYRNGAFPGVALQFNERYLDPDKETLDRIEAKFMARYSGEINNGKPILIPPGMEVKKLHITPPEMGFLESAEQIRDNILALFHVNASVAGISKEMTYGSVLASQMQYYRSAINPLFRFLGQKATRGLAKRYEGLGGRELRVWWEDRTPQDPELQEKQLVTDQLHAAVTPNEVRALRGREPYADPRANDPLVQGAMMSLPFGTGGDILSINSPPIHAEDEPEDDLDADVEADTSDREPSDDSSAGSIDA